MKEAVLFRTVIKVAFFDGKIKRCRITLQEIVFVISEGIFHHKLNSRNWNAPSLSVSRQLKQTRRRLKQKRHLRMYLRVSAIIFQLFKIIMLEKCILTILELIWNQRLGHKRTKLNICHHMLTSSTKLQNRSFHVIERTRTSSKCQMMKKCTCKACKNTVFNCQIS